MKNTGILLALLFVALVGCKSESQLFNGKDLEVAPPDLHTGGVYESYGRGWLVKPEDSKEDVLNYGDWNKMKIRVEGDKVQTWLNGEEMINFSDEKIGDANGKIALQIHDGGGIKVFWRNIKIKNLK